MLSKSFALVTVVLFASVMIATAATPAIGVVTAEGSFLVDNAVVWGNSSLFSGNSIETLGASSQLQLNSGSRLVMASESRGQVYADHLVLNKGGGALKDATGYAIEARTLRVRTDGPGSAVYVALNGANHVQVEALQGRARVTTAQGMLVANLRPGSALEFDPQQAGAAQQSKLRGCLKKEGLAYMLTDSTTDVTVELRGTGLDEQVGKVIEITGAMIPGATAAAGATQVIRVGELNATGDQCAAPGTAAAAGAAATGGAAAGAAAASAGGATILGVSAIAVGVIAAGAGSAIAVAAVKLNASP